MKHGLGRTLSFGIALLSFAQKKRKAGLPTTTGGQAHLPDYGSVSSPREAPFPGLRSKIILITGLVIITICACITWLNSAYYSNVYIETLQSRSMTIAKGLALRVQRITSLGFPINTINGFETQCAEAKQADPDIDYVTIISPDGTVLSHSNLDVIGKHITLQRLTPPPLRGRLNLFPDSNQHYYVMEPLYAPDGDLAAQIVVGFSQHHVDDRLQLLQRSMLLVSLGVAICGLAALTLMLNYFVMRPIKRLMQVIEHIHTNPGDYSVRAEPEKRDDEIGAMLQGVNSLLDEIQQREQELLRAKEDSDRAARSKTEFMAAMSHDLRTPMHAILSMNELMLSTQLNDRQRRYANNLERAGRWLLGIINDVLEFSKIDANKFELRIAEFDPRQLVDDVIGLQEEIAHGKKLELSFRIDPALPDRVMGDGPRLMQVLTNLVSNAIRYTDQGCVLVEVMYTGEYTVFSVTDTGIGIDPDKIHLLWEPFVQVASADAQRRSGTGLGLAIVKLLAEAMGGSVGVDTSLGSGATFWFTARLATPAESNPKLARYPFKHPRNLKQYQEASAA
ncbi:ATP-binding protein [Uliginosibacterium gangwonense]|uniref:sensor histidine kinase n=1 Tax=Uliginosibacterium gangwonense TaxID=392736 RepID=UPI00039ED32F|nr:ATP-binding protein [Uliginosibacterium gangwonense]